MHCRSCRSSSGGQLVFVDATDATIMSKQEHPDISDVEWDPTGRYVTSYVNLYSAKVNRCPWDDCLHLLLLLFF